MSELDQNGNSTIHAQTFSEKKEMYLQMARRARGSGGKPGHKSVGEPGNDGPEVNLLIKCAEDLAQNYQPSGAIFIVEID
jgi:hypothetical protein